MENFYDDDAWCPGWVDVLSQPHTLERTAIIDSDGQRVPYKDLLVRASSEAGTLQKWRWRNREPIRALESDPRQRIGSRSFSPYA